MTRVFSEDISLVTDSAPMQGIFWTFLTDTGNTIVARTRFPIVTMPESDTIWHKISDAVNDMLMIRHGW